VERYNYNRLLEDPDVKRWFRNLERGSPSFAWELLRRIGYVQRRFGKSPQQLAKMTEKQAANFILDVVSALESERKGGKRKLSSTYIANYPKALKNWFEYNGIHVRQKIRVRGGEGKYADEKPPVPDELRKILDMADARAKAACGLVAFSGLRPEVLGNFLGDDGLKVKDFPEMRLGDGLVEFLKVPTMIKVKSGLSKTGKAFFPFLCQEGCDYLKNHLEWRMREGEKLDGASPIMTPQLQQKSLVGQHIRTTNISDLIRKPIRAAGFDWRPYVLRRYFDTRMMMAEGDGLIIRDYRQFWMNHAGDIEHVYTVDKALSKDVVEKMRESYAKAADKYLVTTRRESASQDLMVAVFNKQFLTMTGFSDKEIEKLGDLSKMSAQEVQELIQKRSMASLGLNGNGRQKVVPLDHVKNWIVEGWEYVSTLPTNEAIIRLPTP